jgi:hypothetical protein
MRHRWRPCCRIAQGWKKEWKFRLPTTWHPSLHFIYLSLDSSLFISFLPFLFLSFPSFLFLLSFLSILFHTHIVGGWSLWSSEPQISGAHRHHLPCHLESHLPALTQPEKQQPSRRDPSQHRLPQAPPTH